MRAIAMIQCFGIGVWLLAGCASQPVTLDSIAPDSSWYDPAGLPDMGYLKVYSATESHTIGDGPPYYTHTGYNIHDLSSNRVRFVRNHVGDMDSMPAAVHLASGRYYIVAQSSTHGRVKVPVVIEPSKTTEVYLDGSWRTVPPSGTNSIVFLPNGDAVGWRDSVGGAGK